MIDPRVAHTRTVVTRAAGELLIDSGFERVTIDSIAERSGVARSTIYRNWPNPVDLLVEAFALICDLDDSLDTGAVESDFRALGTMLVHGLNEEAWGRVMPSLIGAAGHDEDLKAAQEGFSNLRRQAAAAMIERGIERGEVPADADVLAATERFVAPFFFRHLMSRLPLDAALVEQQVAGLCSELGMSRD